MNFASLLLNANAQKMETLKVLHEAFGSKEHRHSASTCSSPFECSSIHLFCPVFSPLFS